MFHACSVCVNAKTHGVEKDDKSNAVEQTGRTPELQAGRRETALAPQGAKCS